MILKLEPVAKLNKRNKTTSKNFDDGVMLEFVTLLLLSELISNLDQSGKRIRDA